MTAIAEADRDALREAVSRLLADRSSEADVRAAMDTDSGYDAGLWSQLGELGIVGLIVPEAFGGSGAGPVELEAVMEEMGAALLCSPYLGSSVLSAALLLASGDSDAQGRYLPGIAAGTTIAAAALTGPAAPWTEEGVSMSAAASGSGWALTGTADYVIQAQNADLLLVLARTEAGGCTLFAVDAGAPGVRIAALPTFDHTLRLAQVEFNSALGIPIGAAGAGWDAAEQALDVARVALAGEQAGGARRSLDITVEYAKIRVQFGRPIGSFQAIKHMAADLLLESESATSAARHAAQALADGAPDAGAWISLAAFACADAFTTVTAASIQMHGGIGFTWEHPAHLYLRRARADAQLLGTSSFYRERYIQQLGG
jgi:alkylation response protein AidB-like acyl-CoA dehydrogenase